jgi:NAD(P)-dependent dehydrogenase (short-subunit alcohol dehydrogenase family)
MTRWTAASVPDQRGRTVLITGANTGIGFETAAVLAQAGAHVILAVRDTAKGQRAAAEIGYRCRDSDVTVIPLDLASLASVRAAATCLTDNFGRIDTLVNNAGVMLTPRTTTADGFELQFGTNHLGHFALTGLVLPLLLRSGSSRVVTVSSLGHRVKADIDLDDLQCERHYDRMAAYGRSKLANLLFSYELQRRLDAAGLTGIASVAAHPGNSRTELARNSPRWLKAAFRVTNRVISQSASMGALPILRASCASDVRGGQYYGPRGLAEQRGYPKQVRSSDRSHDADLARRLWSASEELTGVRYVLRSPSKPNRLEHNQ